MSKPTESKVELLHRLVRTILECSQEQTIEILEERLCQEAAARGSDEVEVSVKDLAGFADDFDLQEFEAETVESKIHKAHFQTKRILLVSSSLLSKLLSEII